MKRIPPATGVLLVLTALAFLPLANLPSFDTVKFAALSAGTAFAAVAVARRRAVGTRETALSDPLLLVPAVVALAAAVAAISAWPSGSVTGPALALVCVAAARLVPPGTAGVASTARAVALCAALAGAYALLQSVGLDFAPWASAREPVSTFGNVSFAAEFQAAALPLVLFVAHDAATSRRARALAATAAVIACIHLVLTKSRIDFVAAAAGLAAAWLIAMPDRARARRLAIGCGVAFAALAGLFVLAARGDIAFLGRSDTLQVRVHVWSSAIDVFAAAPLRFGTTPFIDSFPPFRSPEEYRISLGRTVDTPHADLLEIAATLGVAGAVAAAAWIALACRRLAALRDAHPRAAAALAGTIVSIAVSGLASSPLSHPATALLFALAAGHVVSLVPRPVAGRFLSARAADFAAAGVAFVAFWPGPGFAALRSDGFHALAMTARSADRAGEAAALFDTACAANPLAYEPRYELGSFLLSRGELDGAIGALQSAIQVRPHAPDAKTNLVHALRAAGQKDEAAALLDASLRAIPWDPLHLAARASARIAAGDVPGAVADLEVAARTRPWDVRVRAVLVDARLAGGADESAREAALELLEAARAAGDFRVLTQAARAFVARDPLFLAVLTTRARRIAADRPDEAAALVFAPVDGMSPPDAGFFDDASAVLALCGREDEATRFRGRAMGLRARTALAGGDPGSARRLAARAADRDPIPEHRVTEALAFARMAERRPMVDALASALALGPVDVAAFRADPWVQRLLPDPDLELLLERAASRPPPR